MQAISGLFFSLSLVLAVMFGGQTIDYTWGPALVALALALATGGFQMWRLGTQPRSAWFAFAIILMASGWMLWRCWGSPVREYGRSDALLVTAALISCAWAWTMPARGPALRFMLGTLALLGFANLGLCLIQLGDPAFAWPYGSRPAERPSGLFGHYNHLADFSLVSALLLAARAILTRDSLFERIFQASGAVAAAACVVLSNSRGGAISLVAGMAMLSLCFGIVAWRNKKRSLAMIAIVVPVLLGLLFPLVLNKVFQRRGMKTGEFTGIVDDRLRLTMAGYAVKISTSQPWTGSGSRSFGWKKNAVADPMGEKHLYRFNDDFVHNELLQAAVDYGWGGAILIVGAVLTTGLIGVAGLAGRDEPDPLQKAVFDALVCGGLAAMTGTLIHSNFSFVSHTLPGAMYLGLAFGFVLPKREAAEEFLPPPLRLAPGILLFPLAILLGLAGWQGSRAYRILWPVSFGHEFFARTAPPLAVDHVQRAMDLWPGSELAGEAAHSCRAAAADKSLPASEQQAWLTQAVDYYAAAATLNPYDPEWPVNRANVLSSLDRDDEAEHDFERAIELQGGTERNFQARYYFAAHLYRRWYVAWTKERRAGEALGQFLRARELLRETERQNTLFYSGKEGLDLIDGLDRTIRFLEGAQVRPEPVQK